MLIGVTGSVFAAISTKRERIMPWSQHRGHATAADCAGKLDKTGLRATAAAGAMGAIV